MTAEPDNDHWALTLYINGASPHSIHAIENARRLREELGGQVDLEIIDVQQQPRGRAGPDRRRADAGPAYARTARRLVGDLSDSAGCAIPRTRAAGEHRRARNARWVRPCPHRRFPRSRAQAALSPGRPGSNHGEVAELRTELREARETIEAIQGGGVDSLVIGPAGQEQVYSRAGADRTYRLVVEAMSEGAATVSPRGVILDANPRLGLMTGRSGSELVGTAVLDLIPQPHRAEFTRLLDVGASDSARGEMELASLDGTSVPVLLAVSGFDLDGMLLRCLVLTDLSAQRAAEAQTAAAHQALRVSEERLRALVDNAPIGIEELALSGELVQVNPRFCEITGYTADELRSLRIQDITHPGDLDADLANMQRLSSGEIDSFSMEKRDVRKDGGVVWVEANRAVVRDPDGNLVLVVGAVRDITAQREAEAEIGRLNADLEVRVERRTADLALANKNLEAFSYSVSHDLRAPLRALSGYSEALLEDYSDQSRRDRPRVRRAYPGRERADGHAHR